MQRPYEPDLDTIKEQYWEAYLKECEEAGIKPSLSDFDIYLQDKDYVYDEDY